MQEQFNRDEGRALVAVYERVVARQPAAVGSSQIGDVRLPVVRQVLGAGQRRFEQAFVADA
jgi:hypothetical protein